MANLLNQFNANGISFDVADHTARKDIEDIKTEKANIFIAEAPLKYENDILTINLGDYVKENEKDNLETELKDSIATNKEETNDRINEIHNLFKKIFGDYVIIEDSSLSFNSNIPLLKDYNINLEELNTTIETLRNKENNEFFDLSTDLNNKYNELSSSIEELNNTSTGKLENLEKRCSNLENELFGNLDATNYENFESRLDKIETTVNKIYTSLKSIGIIQ